MNVLHRVTRSWRSALRITGLSCLAIVMIGVPVALAVLTASKPTDEARSINATLPSRFALLENIATVVREGNVLQGLLNSLLIAVPTITLLLLLGAMAAWVFARARSRLVRGLYFFAISGIMLPAAIVTTIRVVEVLHIDGSRVALILVYCGVNLSVAVFLMTGFVRGIPIEIEEAARMDGAGTLRVFWSIILPALRPVLLTSGIVLALAIWNDFFTPFFLLSDRDAYTLPQGLYNFASANAYQLNWNLILTHILLVSLPLLIVYVLAQKRIVGGLLGGVGK